MKPRSLRRLLTLSTLPLALSLALPLACAAAPLELNIPAQPLAVSLKQLSRLAGVTLAMDDQQVARRPAVALQGRYEFSDALQALLAGSGLSARQEGGVWLIASPQASGALDLPVTTINSQADSLVTEGTGSYTTGQVSIGKAPLSIKDTPQTVSVVSQQRIQDQKLTNLDRTMKSVTGVTQKQGNSNSYTYLSRGFAFTNYKVDGSSAIGSSSGWSELDTALFDHVEVLRGSDGLFSGVGEPGGTVNLVRKRPTAQAQGSFETSIGSWNDQRNVLDVSGPLGFDGRLRGRTILVYQDKDYFYDKASSRSTLINGMLEADLTDATTALLGFTYSRFKTGQQTYGLPRYKNGDDLKLPRSTFLAGVDDYDLRTLKTSFMNLKHQLNSDWSANLDVIYTEGMDVVGNYNFSGSVDPQTGSGVGAGWGWSYVPLREVSADLSLRGTFDLFGLEHGATLGWSTLKQPSMTHLYEGGPYRDIPNIFTFDPEDYRNQKADRTLTDLMAYSTRVSSLYGSLRLQLAQPLHWFVGGSLSNYRYDYNDHVVDSGENYPTQYKDNHVLTPYTGVTYALTPQWTGYASVAKIYKSQASRLKGPTLGATPLDPITGTTYETGIKGQLLDGRLNTYVALYRTTRNGEAVRDTRYPRQSDSLGASCCWLGDGEVVSKGLDFEVSGELLNGLQATFGYTYNHNENKYDGTTYSSLTPRHLAKLFASYQMPGAWSRLKVGGGVTAQSANYVSGSAVQTTISGAALGESTPYKFTESGYALWSAFANYKIDEHWSVSANLENIFDKKYYSTVGYSDYGNFYGTPRSYIMSLRADF